MQRNYNKQSSNRVIEQCRKFGRYYNPCTEEIFAKGNVLSLEWNADVVIDGENRNSDNSALRKA